VLALFFSLTSFGFFGIFELSTSVPAVCPARREADEEGLAGIKYEEESAVAHQ
jgi:hypothetical protein